MEFYPSTDFTATKDNKKRVNHFYDVNTEK